MADEQRGERAARMASERRRRQDGEMGKRLHLAIPEEVRERLAAEGRTPRWVNDEGSRVADLTIRDDYDPVEGVEPVKVDVDKEGKPVYAKVFAKRNDFIAEDQAKAEQRRRKTEAGMMRGDLSASPGGGGQQIEGAMGAPVYVDSRSTIRRANRINDD